MTNKEKYKQAFDTLSTSDNFSLEVDKMSILNRKPEPEQPTLPILAEFSGKSSSGSTEIRQLLL